MTQVVGGAAGRGRMSGVTTLDCWKRSLTHISSGHSLTLPRPHHKWRLIRMGNRLQDAFGNEGLPGRWDLLDRMRQAQWTNVDKHPCAFHVSCTIQFSQFAVGLPLLVVGRRTILFCSKKPEWILLNLTYRNRLLQLSSFNFMHVPRWPCRGSLKAQLSRTALLTCDWTSVWCIPECTGLGGHWSLEILWMARTIIIYHLSCCILMKLFSRGKGRAALFFTLFAGTGSHLQVCCRDLSGVVLWQDFDKGPRL